MSFPRFDSELVELRGLFVALQSGLGDDLRSIRAGGEARYFMAMSRDFTMKSLGISRVVSPSNIGDWTDWSIKNWDSTKTGWWFGTFIFPHIGNNHPNWLIFCTENLDSTKKEGFHQKVTSWFHHGNQVGVAAPFNLQLSVQISGQMPLGVQLVRVFMGENFTEVGIEPLEFWSYNTIEPYRTPRITMWESF